MNYWVIPGIKLLRQFKQGIPLPNTRTSITIYKKSKIFVSYLAIQEMNIRYGDKLNFVESGREFFICKSNEGNVLCRDHNSGYVSANEFIHRFKELYHPRKNIKCELQKTRAELNGERLFRIIIPLIYISKNRTQTKHTQ